MTGTMTKALANGLARYEVAARMRNPNSATRIDQPLATLAYGEKAVPPEVVRDLLTRYWIVSAGPGQGYVLSETGRNQLNKYIALHLKNKKEQA